MAGSEQQRPEGLGISGWDTYEFIVTDLERSRKFYTEMMDVPELARLDEREAARRGEDSILFRAGKATFVCTTPREQGSRASRWLQRHPDGVSIVGLRVRDLDHTYRALHERGANLISDIENGHDWQERPYRFVDVATPLGEVRFRFVERPPDTIVPHFRPAEPGPQRNRHNFQVIDHITSNFLTIEPHITWLRDVLGFEEYWRVHFHTADVNKATTGGSGLASIVMWDPGSGIKFANNEPAAPNYENSQIYTFCTQNFGPGVQHVAFHVPQIMPCVESLHAQGIQFLDTPATYYDMLPERMAQRRVPNLKEKLDDLKKLKILVDGADERYLLQIFMVEGGVLYHDAEAGPFFYEVIQRCGARGFGEGNFRALFEAIERDQVQRGVVQKQLDAGAGS
jgi:4-hydroxyphenylpyruvate dioxygenase